MLSVWFVIGQPDSDSDSSNDHDTEQDTASLNSTINELIEDAENARNNFFGDLNAENNSSVATGSSADANNSTHTFGLAVDTHADVEQVGNNFQNYLINSARNATSNLMDGARNLLNEATPKAGREAFFGEDSRGNEVGQDKGANVDGQDEGANDKGPFGSLQDDIGRRKSARISRSQSQENI